MEVSNLSDTEFKVMVIRMLNSVKKDLETIMKDQPEMKNIISERKITQEGRNCRMGEAED